MISTQKARELLGSFEKTVGLEVEFNVVDGQTGAPVGLDNRDGHRVMRIVMAKIRQRLSRSKRGKFAARLDELVRSSRLGWHLSTDLGYVAEELPIWVIEAVSPVCHSYAELRSWLLAIVDLLREELAEFGLVLIGIDLHPQVGIFRRDYVPEDPEYLRRDVWDGNLRPDGSTPLHLSGAVTGVHIHHGTYRDEAEAFHLLRQAMPLVPMFIGGTANGAIAHRDLVDGLGLTISNDAGEQQIVDSSWATIRPRAWQQLGHGIGPAFHNEHELWLQLIKNRLEGHGGDRLKQYYWIARRIESKWAFKKGALLKTNEHREMGVPPTVEDILAWAALKMVSENAHRCMYQLGTPRFPYMEEGPSDRYTAQIDADCEAAARGGMEGIITNPYSGDPEDRVTVADVTRQTVYETQPVAEAMGPDLVKKMEHIHWTTEEGNSASQRHRRAFKEGGLDGLLQYQGGLDRVLQYHIKAMNP